MSGFFNFCKQLTPLDAAAEIDLVGRLKARQLGPQDFLLRPGANCEHIYFVEQGLAKTFFVREDKECIMQFFAENSMFTVLDSFLTRKPSTYGVVALEPTTISYLSTYDLDVLCARHHSLETFFRKLVSLASLQMMKRISEMLNENARERYAHFVTENRPLMQRISLGSLANYLGITQVTLSRIRARPD